MATDTKARPNKQSTISFTLPLSCQICLGKVKQPVLCSNHHVFCQLCMDIWLEKNQQCPTCRVEISEENPVRNVIGGQLEDEDKSSRQSTAEIRRVRFELLYREYEDEFEQMKKELLILKTENNILAAQLKDAEDENEDHRKAGDKQPSNSSTKDGPNLLHLTQNLQEAQKLYAGIKGDMTNLKQENGKLKDENINLTRENETLRLEIAQRSPKKFGRYTVVTLEAKVSELEKENRQLENALQRSDTYIEDLENQISKLSDVREVNHLKVKSYSGGSSKINDQGSGKFAPMTTGSSASDQFGASEASSSSVKRALFNNESLPKSGRVDTFMETRHSHTNVTGAECLQNGFHMEEEEEISPENKECISMNGIQKQPESIMKSNAAASATRTGRQGNESLSVERKSKKVKFDIQGDDNVSSSFDLELPSPYGHNISNSPRPSQQVGKSIQGKKANFSSNSESDNERLRDGTKSSSAFDDYITNLIEKSQPQSSSRSLPNSNLSSAYHSKHNTKEYSKANNLHNSRSLESHDNEDSSHLSVPDLNSPENEHNHLIDTQYRMKGETGELNISMTPELSDCLQLMDQAERKLEQRPTDRQPFPERGVNAMKSAQEDFSELSISKQSHVPTSVPHSLYSSLKSKASSSLPSFIPTADVSWKQQFYSSLSANPYKFNPSVGSLSRSQTVSSTNGKNPDKPNPLSSRESLLSTELNAQNKDYQISMDTVIPPVRPPSRNSLYDLDSKFLSTSQSNSNVYRPTLSTSMSTSSTKLNTNYTGDGASNMSSNSYSNVHADPLKSTLLSDRNLFSFPSADVQCPVRQPPSSSAPSLPFSSLYNNLPHNSSNGLPSSSLHNHTEPVSSLSSYPSSSLAFSNPLPPSLNNSALEWPDDSSELLLPRTNGVRFKSSDTLSANNSDTLPLPSRDRASLDQSSGTYTLRNGKHNNVNNSFISSSLMSDDNSFHLPEPKKRLFNNTDDDLELPSSPMKSTRR